MDLGINKYTPLRPQFGPLFANWCIMKFAMAIEVF